MPPNPMTAPRINRNAALVAALGDTGIPGKKEVVDYTFFDQKSWTTVTAASQTYFASAGTDPRVSNFQGAGSMPSGQAMLVTSLRVIPFFGSPGADVISAMKEITLAFTLENSKKYAEGMIGLYPAGVGATLENINGTTAALSTGISLGNPGVPSMGNVYRFSNPIVLRPLQSFAVTLTASASFTAVTSPMKIWVAIDGLFVRNTI